MSIHRMTQRKGFNVTNTERRMIDRRIAEDRRATVSACLDADRRSRVLIDRRLAVRNQITSLRQANWYERYHAARLG